MTSVRENLIAARALIDTPEKWTKGRFTRARLSPMTRTDGRDDRQVVGYAFCAEGACDQARRRLGGQEPLDVLQSSLPTGFYSVAMFNDDPATTHADIMALFDRAISSTGEPSNG